MVERVWRTNAALGREAFLRDEALFFQTQQLLPALAPAPARLALGLDLTVN